MSVHHSEDHITTRQDAARISEDDVRAAADGDVDAYRRLQDPTGQHPASELEIIRFLARGGPRLQSQLQRMQYLGIVIDPDSRFAQRLTQFRDDVEAATNGDFAAYLRLHTANGTIPNQDDIIAFLANGGPPLLETARQRQLLGMTTDPESPFGQRMAAWLEARFNAPDDPSPRAGDRPPTTPPSGGTSRPQSVPPPVAGSGGPTDGAPAHEPPAHPPSHPADGRQAPSTDAPAASTGRTVSFGFGNGNINEMWSATGTYRDGILIVTKTVTDARGHTTTTTTTTTGEDARRAFDAAVAEQAWRDADQAAKDKAAQDQAAREKAAMDKADAEAADADPDPDRGAEYRNPDATEAGGPGPIRIGDAERPRGAAGRAPFGGDYGNPMSAEFVGGALVIRVSAGPDLDPDANQGGGAMTLAHGDAPIGAAGRLPFGGDFGNPSNRRDIGAGTPPHDNGVNPYA